MKTHDKTITATEFKAKCLRILENLGSRGLVITKRGKPVARILPAGSRVKEEIIGSMRDRIRVRGDVFSTGVRWDAES